MAIGKIGTVLYKLTTSTTGIVPANTVKNPSNLLKFSESPILDMLALSKTSREDKIRKKLVDNMIAQRDLMKANDEILLDRLYGYKEYCVCENEVIRKNIVDFLEKNEPLNEKLVELDTIIAQSKIPQATTLYRGSTAFDFGFKDMTAADFIEKFYKKGRIFQIPIFSSTSLKKPVAEKFAEQYTMGQTEKGILFKINCPKDTNGIYMEKLGKPLKGCHGIEEEILLPRNLLYKFKSISEKEKYTEIELDVLPEKPFFGKVYEFWKEIQASSNTK